MLTVTIFNEKGEMVKTWIGVGEVKQVPGAVPVLAFISPLGNPMGIHVMGQGFSAEFTQGVMQ